MIPEHPIRKLHNLSHRFGAQVAIDKLRLLDEIAAAGTAVLLATHDPMVVQNAASTQIIRLEEGRVDQILPGLRTPLAGRLPTRAAPPAGRFDAAVPALAPVGGLP